VLFGYRYIQAVLILIVHLVYECALLQQQLHHLVRALVTRHMQRIIIINMVVIKDQIAGYELFANIKETQATAQV